MSTYEIVIKTEGATLLRAFTCESVVEAFDNVRDKIAQVDGWGKTVEAVTVTLIPEVNQ
jgi:hypothetical protein